MMHQIDTPMSRALAQRVLTLDAVATPSTNDLLDLTTPEPVAPPEHVRAAAKAALDADETHYTARPGIAPLRQAIAAHSTAAGYPATADDIVVTNGGSEALYIALQALLTPGQQALLGGPVAANVARLLRFIGAELVWLPASARNGFVPTPKDVAGSDARVLLLASPNPATGALLPPARLAQLVEAALERGMTVILDRSLADCCYDSGAAHAPDPALGARVLTIGSFSESFALSGWRVGWFAAPPAQLELAAMRELKQAMSICTSAVSQFAALAALDGPPDWLAARRASLVARRDWALAALRAGGLDVVTPDAWPALLIDARLIHPDDHAAADLIAHSSGVRVQPVSDYGPATRGYVRLRLDVPDATLRDGVRHLIGFHNTCA
jgi:aspartate/methionine/tyrosine aminotransferase